MPTLVYKADAQRRPGQLGHFGIPDCMGSVRSWAFDSVIGVGGQGAEAESSDIACKLNRTRRGAQDVPPGPGQSARDFDQFRDFGTDGPLLQLIAPNLARRMYEKRARTAMYFSPLELTKIKRILTMVAVAGKSAEVLEEETTIKRQVCCRRNVGVFRGLEAIMTQAPGCSARAAGVSAK